MFLKLLSLFLYTNLNLNLRYESALWTKLEKFGDGACFFFLCILISVISLFFVDCMVIFYIIHLFIILVAFILVGFYLIRFFFIENVFILIRIIPIFVSLGTSALCSDTWSHVLVSGIKDSFLTSDTVFIGAVLVVGAGVLSYCFPEGFNPLKKKEKNTESATLLQEKYDCFVAAQEQVQNKKNLMEENQRLLSQYENDLYGTLNDIYELEKEKKTLKIKLLEDELLYLHQKEINDLKTLLNYLDKTFGEFNCKYLRSVSDYESAVVSLSVAEQEYLGFLSSLNLTIKEVAEVIPPKVDTNLPESMGWIDWCLYWFF